MSLRVLVCTCKRKILRKDASYRLIRAVYVRGCRQHAVFYSNSGYGSIGMNEGSKTNDDDKSSVSVTSINKPQEDQKSRHQMKTIPNKDRS